MTAHVILVERLKSNRSFLECYDCEWSSTVCNDKFNRGVRKELKSHWKDNLGIEDVSREHRCVVISYFGICSPSCLSCSWEGSYSLNPYDLVKEAKKHIAENAT